jgi:hypothetical protein
MIGTVAILIERLAVDTVLELSVTWRAKLNAPAVVGAPVIAPAFRVNPAGKAPEVIDQVYGETPPEAAKVCEYATPTSPPDKVVVVMEGAVVMLIERIAALVTLTLSET